MNHRILIHSILLMAFGAFIPVWSSEIRTPLTRSEILLKALKARLEKVEPTKETPVSEQEKNTCPICFEVYSETYLPLQFNCEPEKEEKTAAAHIMCINCTTDYIKSNNSCPQCRADLCLFDPAIQENIPTGAEGLSYEKEGVKRQLEAIKAKIPTSTTKYKQAVTEEKTPSPEKPRAQQLCALGSEALCGALVGTAVGVELSGNKNPETLKFQRLSYLALFLGTSHFLNSKNPERKANGLHIACWGAGLIGGALLRSYLSSEESSVEDTST